MVQPTLKWAGGKRQLLDNIVQLFPDVSDPAVNTYYEPFLGGGAVAFGTEPQRAVLNDINTRLMNYYRVVKHRPEDLIATLRSFRAPESTVDEDRGFADTSHFGYDIENYYYQQRALFNRRPYGYEYDRVEEAALLQYLNRTCFNGLYRENQSGGFNTPIGEYENPDWVQKERVWDLHEYLSTADVRLMSDGYTDGLATISAGDLVYADPPYKPVSATADFTEYSADGFDQDDQLELLETLSSLADDGVHVVASNSAVMAEKYADAGFDVYTVDATRAINSDAENRDAVEEIIAVMRA